jgi:hypothetical protein
MATKSEIQAADYRAEAIASPFAAAAERSVPVSKTEEAQSGMRTERVTLEIKHFDDNDGDSVYRWNWPEMMAVQGLGINESVRVVEECCLDRINMGEVIRQRDAAIRERDSLREQLESVADRAAAAEMALDARTSTAGEASCDAPAASGLEQQSVSSGASQAQAGESGQIGRLEAASGGGEPVMWGVRERRTPDATLIEAVRILSRTITTEDGVIPACLVEVATRLEELVEERRSISTLHQKVESLEEEIALLREARRWVPVGERLPELNEANYFRVNCLVYCKSGGVCEMTYEINTYAKHERHRYPRWKRHGMISMWEVTHWQPLPGPEGEA